MKLLELPLWTVLQAATNAPDQADVLQLLQALDDALPPLEMPDQLQVAAEAIYQIAEVLQDRSEQVLEVLTTAVSEDGPIMPADAFDHYVRQTMEVDFEPFLAPLATFSGASAGGRPDGELLPAQADDEPVMGSVVGELDRAAFLQQLDQHMQQHPGLTEADVLEQVLALAHDEDIANWVAAIATWMTEQHVIAVPLLQLQQAVKLPLVQVWLALLLGGFVVEQRGGFYETQHVWVVGPWRGAIA